MPNREAAVVPLVPRLSRAVEELIRIVATEALQPERGVLSDVEAAALQPIQDRFRNFPALSEETLASTRENVKHWLQSIQSTPMLPVKPALNAPVLGIARSMAQRGAAQDLWAAYSAGREAMWRNWMRLLFEYAPDQETLSDALNVVSASLSNWIDETIRQLTTQLAEESGHDVGATHELKLQTATRILDGTPLDDELAGFRLKYPLTGQHLAAIVWTDPGAPDPAALRRAVELLKRADPHQKALSVPATSSSMWLWLNHPGPEIQARLSQIISGLPHVWLALGATGAGVEGFRRSHYEAVETQRLMVRVGHVQTASFDDVSLAALGAHNEQAAREFVARVLGDLGTAPAELRETVRVYIRHMYNASKTADEVYTHRNTVFHRIQRAEELLPRPLAVSGVEVGAALELQRWLA